MVRSHKRRQVYAFRVIEMRKVWTSLHEGEELTALVRQYIKNVGHGQCHRDYTNPAMDQRGKVHPWWNTQKCVVVNPLGCKENGTQFDNDWSSQGEYTPLEAMGDRSPR